MKTVFDQYRTQLEKTHRGYFSPFKILEAIKAATELPFAEAMKIERKLFEECRESSHSRAQRTLFFAERTVSKIPDVPKETPVREIKKVAVIGAGTMGTGIAMNFLNAGLAVTLLESEKSYLDNGLNKITETYSAAVAKGRMSEDQKADTLKHITGVLDFDAINDADVIIEAVFENMDVKKEVFNKIDSVAKPGAILASNTSTLDIDVIAAVTGRAEDVIGLHFFAPANIMPLLEIVRGEKTATDVIATAMSLAKTIRKTGVLVGNCFGFVGNRMFIPYIREAQLMLLEGVAPERIDQVAYDWGMAMGPNAVVDLSGVDVMQKIIDAWDGKPDDPSFYRLITVLNDMGRFGQKTGAGIYQYDGRKPSPDDVVKAIIKSEAGSLGIKQREIDDQEIIERLFYSMINEGAKILEEKIALRASDIDVIWTSGYGMPRYRGGPMMVADMIGLREVYDGICKHKDRYGEQYWQPASLLKNLADEGGSFY